MAEDSEQTLQNHQQPNGGEPLPDRRQRGHGQRQGTAGPRGRRSLPPPFCSPPGSRPAAAHVAGGRGPCQLLQPPRGPRASAPGSAPVPSPPCADLGAAAGTGGRGAGPPRFPVPRLPIAGLARSSGGSDSWPGPVGGAEKTDALACKSDVGRGLPSRDASTARGTPSSPVLALMLAQRRSPGAKGGASRAALPGRLRESAGSVRRRGAPPGLDAGAGDCRGFRENPNMSQNKRR